MDDQAAQSRPILLVAEDDEAIRSLITEILMGEGYDVVTASDGQQALDFAMGRRIDLVLLDLQMPNLDGAGFCRAYREHPEAAPVVLLTAVGPDIVEAAIEACGAVGYIPKPFNLADVLAIVEQHVAPSA